MENEQQSNLLLAVALSILVLIGWNFVMAKYFSPADEAQEQSAPTETAAPAPTQRIPSTPEEPAAAARPARITPEPAEPSAPPVEPEAPAREIAVETAALELRFTSEGAVLRSARLPEFASKVAGSVELIPTPEAGAPNSYPLDIALPDGRRLSETTFYLRRLTADDPAYARMLEAAAAFLEQPARSADPATLQGDAVGALQTDGADAALAWAVGRALTDVPLSEDGELEQGWSARAQDNLSALRAATVLDYHIPWEQGATLHKVLTVYPSTYAIDLNIILAGGDGTAAELGGASEYRLIWGPGLETSERSARNDPLQAAWLEKGSLKRKAPSTGLLGRKAGPDGLPPPIDAPPDAEWYALQRKYFMAGVNPMFEGTHARFVSLPSAEKAQRLEMQIAAPSLRAEPGETVGQRYVIALAPIHGAELAAVGHAYDLALNFGFFDLFGKAMLRGLLLLNGFVRNYGLAIILLTIFVRLALFPLNQRAYQSMKAMSVIQPKVTEMREQYKNNPQEMNKRIWEMYREHNINPLGGCLPIVFQMPVFLALFNALRSAIELRGAGFLWITDLSEPDALATIPGLFDINILPILMAGAMFVQQKMSTPAANPTSDPNIEMQRKMMTWMPILFGFMFYGMPSGLTIYWLVSTVLGIGQQYYVNKA